jgi:hypothetical protein
MTPTTSRKLGSGFPRRSQHADRVARPTDDHEVMGTSGHEELSAPGGRVEGFDGLTQGSGAHSKGLGQGRV